MTALEELGNIPDYRHYPKVIVPGEPLVLPNAYFKWYDVHREDTPVDDALRAEARAFLAKESFENELGFIILHRCGESFYFLIVITWRNANEMWEALYAKDGDAPFALFEQPPRHKPMLCVWELGAVLHEQQAWIRYLYSARDEEAKRAYVSDQFRGTV